MPQLSGSRSANPSPGMRTLRQISNPALPVGPTAQGEAPVPTHSSHGTESQKPTNALTAPVLPRVHVGHLEQHHSAQGQPLWHWDSLDPESRTQRNNLSCSGETSAVMQEFEHAAPYRALKPNRASHRPGTSSYGTHSFCQGSQAHRNLIFTLLAILIPPENGLTNPAGVCAQPQQPEASCSLQPLWR